MRIALVASELENTPELAVFGAASYAHKLLRLQECDYLFFPLSRFLSPMSKATKSMLLHLAEEYRCPIGIGFFEEGKDIYRVFLPSGEILETEDYLFIHSEISLNLFELQKSEGVAVLLGKEKVDAESFAKVVNPAIEVYYLGYCQDDAYQALVYEGGKIKCRIPESGANILLKNVPERR